jgi:hypothetical protein
MQNTCAVDFLYGPHSRLKACFSLQECPDFAPRYNIAPTSDVLVIRQRPEVGRVGQMVRWGLVPNWAKDTSGLLCGFRDLVLGQGGANRCSLSPQLLECRLRRGCRRVAAETVSPSTSAGRLWSKRDFLRLRHGAVLRLGLFHRAGLGVNHRG